MDYVPGAQEALLLGIGWWWVWLVKGTAAVAEFVLLCSRGGDSELSAMEERLS